jgi:hypothetical protein
MGRATSGAARCGRTGRRPAPVSSQPGASADQRQRPRALQARIGAGVMVMVNRGSHCLKALQPVPVGPSATTRPRQRPASHPAAPVLEAEEEAQLVTAAAEPLRTMVLVGMRPPPALRSSHAPVDVGLRGLLTSRRPTSQGRHGRPAQQRAAALDPFAAGRGTFSLRRTFVSLDRTIPDGLQRAGLGRHPHVLRHTFASGSPWPASTADDSGAGGWALEMVERYTQARLWAGSRRAVARNSPTLFTTPPAPRILVPSSARNPLPPP